MKTYKSIILTLMVFVISLSSIGMTNLALERDADQNVDLQEYLDKQIASGKKVIVIPPGRYRVAPTNQNHILLADLEGVTINAEGVEMICTETTRALTISNCTDTVITGLTIDYDPLPYTQGKIVKISPDKLTHDIELFDGYPQEGTFGQPHKAEVFSAKTKSLILGEYYLSDAINLGKGKLRLVKRTRDLDHPEELGDIIAISFLNTPGGYEPHAVYLEQCDSVTLERITVYSSNCFGFFELGCSASVYQNCTIDRRPVETDFKKRESPRIRSLNADAYHSTNAQKGPSYIKCKAKYMGDDCVAINGDYHLVMASSGNKLRVLAKYDMNIEKDDVVEFFALNGNWVPDAKVISIKADGEITAEEKSIRENLLLHPRHRQGVEDSLTKAYELVMDRAVELEPGSLICSANRIGNGFKVIDCELGENRSRGILVKAGNGVISGNTLAGCRMYPILLAPEYLWMEAGSGSDVLIKDNLIKDCGKTGIKVEAKTATRDDAEPGAHRNITITGNRIENGPSPQIYVKSTDGLIIRDNVILQDGKPIAEDIETGNSVNVQLNLK